MRAPMTPKRENEREQIQRLLYDVLTVRPDELACDGCLAGVARYVELEAAGQDAAREMPLIAHHLQHCAECCEEYRVLRRMVG